MDEEYTNPACSKPEHKNSNWVSNETGYHCEDCEKEKRKELKTIYDPDWDLGE
jgi:hypothetical protein